MVRQIVLDEPFLACQNDLGEGCLWDKDTGLLYWVDIKKAQIHTLDPKTKAHSVEAYQGSDPYISAIALRKDQPGFLGAQKYRLVTFPEPSRPSTDNNGQSVDRSNEVGPLPSGKDFEIPKKYRSRGEVRLNDGACDAKGRFWIGSMGIDESTGAGQLYRYDPDGSVQMMLDNIGCSNGIGWSPDNKLMYYIDSPSKNVSVMDYDLENGTVSNRRVFADASLLPACKDGVYDGLCMDAEGAVWAARWGNSRVVRIMPDGTPDIEIVIPKALNVTCCIFGGPDMQDLFITTASCNQTDASLVPQYPQGGDLFHVKIDGVKGVERFKFGA